MAVRPHAERLLFDLSEIRQELLQEAGRIPSEELDWVPADGMKSYRRLLIEIACVEAENIGLIKSGNADYKAVEARLSDPALDTASLLNGMQDLRAETIEYLSQVSEEALQTPIAMPSGWEVFYGGKTEMEPEELIRWITRHEYYHLGQIITMRWMQGHNPYQPQG